MRAACGKGPLHHGLLEAPEVGGGGRVALRCLESMSQLRDLFAVAADPCSTVLGEALVKSSSL